MGGRSPHLEPSICQLSERRACVILRCELAQRAPLYNRRSKSCAFHGAVSELPPSSQKYGANSEQEQNDSQHEGRLSGACGARMRRHMNRSPRSVAPRRHGRIRTQLAGTRPNPSNAFLASTAGASGRRLASEARVHRGHGAAHPLGLRIVLRPPYRKRPRS